MNREEINEYDLGLPVPIAPRDERREGVPSAVWASLRRLEAGLVARFDARLQKLVLFGSCARSQLNEESDVDVLRG